MTRSRLALGAVALATAALLGSACSPAKPAVAIASYCGRDFSGKHDIVKVNLSRPTPGTWVEVYDAGNYNAFLTIDQFDSEPDLFLHLPNYGTVSDQVKIVITWPDWTETTRRASLVPGCYG